MSGCRDHVRGWFCGVLCAGQAVRVPCMLLLIAPFLCCASIVVDSDTKAQPTTTLLGFVADLLKWLGAISRFLNIYTILIAMESPLATERFAFETCTQAPSDMCITTILFKWQQAVVELFRFEA